MDTMQAPQQAPPMQPPGQPPMDDGGMDGLGEEMARGLTGISRALYEDDKMSDTILSSISPQEKVGSTAKAVILLITQMDKKLDLAEEVLGALTLIAADRLMELVEADKRQKITYSDMEAKQVVMTSIEGMLQSYGATPEDSQAAMAGMSEQDIQSAKGTYEETLNG